MRRAGTVAIIVAAVIALGVIGWRVFNPGPMAFAGGATVALSDYHAKDPTGVPAELANASLVKRGEYLARAADCVVCHTAPGGAPMPAAWLYRCRSERCIPRTSRRTKAPA